MILRSGRSKEVKLVTRVVTFVAPTRGSQADNGPD